MFLCIKQNIKETKKDYEEVCKNFLNISNLLIINKNRKLGVIIKSVTILTSVMGKVCIRILNIVDYNIYYCSQKNFNYIKNKKYVINKNLFKNVFIIKAKHNKKQLNRILNNKNKFKKII